MTKFKSFVDSNGWVSEFELTIDIPLRIDEGINRKIIIHPTEFVGVIPGVGTKKAEYEWYCGDDKFYLFAFKSNEESTIWDFKFVNQDLRVDRTGELKGKSASSALSGAILAIKEFLDNHPNYLWFSISCNKNDEGRMSIYSFGTKYIARECNVEFMGTMDSDDNKFVKFVFKK